MIWNCTNYFKTEKKQGALVKTENLFIETKS